MGRAEWLSVGQGRIRWNEEIARKALSAHRASGLSEAAFARQHGLNAQRFAWWRRRLAGGETRLRPQPSNVRLAPAVVVATRRALVRIGGRIEIEGIDPRELPVDWLADLVRALADER